MTFLGEALQRLRASGPARQSAMYWRMMSAKLVSGRRPRRAARAAVAPVGQLATMPAMRLVALEAHALAHFAAGHLLERVEHLGDAHVERRQVERRAAAEGSRLAS